MLAEVNSSLRYETVKETFHQPNPGYESLPGPDSLTPGYERIRDPNNGYEKIRYATAKEDESDPNYEELKPQTNDDEPFHCYATINKKNGNSKTVVSSSEGKLAEHDYASLTRHANQAELDGSGADADAGMENDPFYERIHRRAPDTSNNDSKDDMNNNHSNAISYPSASSPSSSREDESSKRYNTPVTNVNDLYSKVNKNVKR